MFEAMDQGLPPSVNSILEAIELLMLARNDITRDTIGNCLLLCYL